VLAYRHRPRVMAPGWGSIPVQGILGLYSRERPSTATGGGAFSSHYVHGRYTLGYLRGGGPM
jgi:hypothetical protein